MSNRAERIYNVKVVRSGKRTEYYFYNTLIREGKESNNSEGRKGKETVSEENKGRNKELSKLQNLNKARNKIVRLVSSNSFSSFITLTYSENMKDISKSKEHIKLFFKKLKKDFKDLKYLYVIEFQERGAIHYHILTNIEFKGLSNTKRKTKEHKAIERDFSKKYWSSRGFIDIRDIREGSEVRNISKYISSYIVQDLFEVDLKGNKIYGYSRNLNKPVTETYLDTFAAAEEFLDKEGKTQYINSYDVRYVDNKGESRGGKVVYFDNIDMEGIYENK